MKSWVKVLVLITMGLCLSACHKDNISDDSGENNITTDDKIIITCSSWNGWSSDYESKDKTFEYVAKEGKVITLDCMISKDDFEIQIIEVNEKSIIIKTNQYMSCREVGEHTINLNSKEDTFEINRGEKIELITPTTDAGDIFIIEY